MHAYSTKHLLHTVEYTNTGADTSCAIHVRVMEILRSDRADTPTDEPMVAGKAALQ